jgi:hypothetical protein
VQNQKHNFRLSGDQTNPGDLRTHRPRLSTGGDSFTADTYPQKVLELFTPKNLHRPVRIYFKLKHGVWFWTKHDRHPDLRNLDDWGDTVPAIERMCEHVGFIMRWARTNDLTQPDHAYRSER